jgi:hypothetical protein
MIKREIQLCHGSTEHAGASIIYKPVWIYGRRWILDGVLANY